MKVFFHSADLDGHASGAIVKHKYPDCEMMPINYGDEFPWDSIEDDEQIFMVDFSLKEMSDMKRLDKLTHFCWIDHHKTAIEAAKEANFNPQGMRDEKFAACELTWKFLFYEEIPCAVHLLGKYDIWQHEDPDVLPFQYGMRSFDTTPAINKNMIKWRSIFLKKHEDLKNILEIGHTILKYTKSYHQKLCKALSYEFEFEGHRCIAINQGFASSQVFDSVFDAEKHDIMIAYYNKNGKHWYVSLYTTKTDTIDASKICKKYGGGGHPGAAGFTTRELPFPLFEE